jgi:hypothetical protein
MKAKAKKTDIADTDIVVSAAVPQWNRRRVLKVLKLVLPVAILAVAIVVIGIGVHDHWFESAATKRANQKQQVAAIPKMTSDAIQPNITQDFDQTEANLKKEAATNKYAQSDPNFQFALFSACYNNNDKPCMRAQAQLLLSSDSRDKALFASFPKPLQDKIREASK